MAAEDWVDYADFVDQEPPWRETPRHHGEPWTPLLDRNLVDLLRSKVQLPTIAGIMGRTLVAIEMRIEYLATTQERKAKMEGYIEQLVGRPRYKPVKRKPHRKR